MHNAIFEELAANFKRMGVREAGGLGTDLVKRAGWERRIPSNCET